MFFVIFSRIRFDFIVCATHFIFFSRTLPAFLFLRAAARSAHARNVFWAPLMALSVMRVEMAITATKATALGSRPVAA